jgi:anhydro-N-acetylmuramic acid kinase
MSKLYIGIMSGTSLDGVDVALCEINAESCKLLHFKEFSFDSELKRRVLDTINSTTTLSDIGRLDTELGFMFSNVVQSFLELYSLKSEDIRAIGLHGQTLWHEPDSKFPFSIQLGSSNVVVAQTGIKVVSDFRNMDIANGGEGAPFAPAFHKEIFKNLSQKTAVLNIGGMANITLLDETLRGWDTGCGNVLLDYWMMQTKQKSYDKDGKFARSGTLNVALLDSMLSDTYFTKEPPKSTGREYFNATWLANYLPVFQTLHDADIQRTLLELTARSIAKDVSEADRELLILCGGGAKNSFLLQRLQELTAIEVQRSDELGVSSDALEAMAFAWLAYKRMNREEVDLKSVTGAEKNSILGAVYG